MPLYEAKVKVWEIQTWVVKAKNKADAINLIEWGDSPDIKKEDGDSSSWYIESIRMKK